MCARSVTSDRSNTLFVRLALNRDHGTRLDKGPWLDRMWTSGHPVDTTGFIHIGHESPECSRTANFAAYLC